MDAMILVDVLDSHGKMISRQRLQLTLSGSPLVIGRDVACDIVINDPYAAARHASLSLHEDGSVRITDLNTVNGLILQGERVNPTQPVALPDGQVQVGHSHLRIRSAAGLLAPERRDLESLRSRHREYGVSLAGGLLCAGFAGYAAWVGSPDNEPIAVATNLVLGTLVLAPWFAFWVLLGRSVRSRWQWSANAAITLGAAAALLWLRWVTDATVFATGMPLVARLGEGLAVLIAGVTIFLYVRTATRSRKQVAATIACVIPLIGFAAYLWFMHQRHAEDVNYITPPGQIFPPSWSRHPGMRLDKFFDEGLDLRDAADQHRVEVRIRETEDPGERD
jgi:hypothetical protein